MPYFITDVQGKPETWMSVHDQGRGIFKKCTVQDKDKNKRGGVVFYVNDELGCKEVKKA